MKEVKIKKESLDEIVDSKEVGSIDQSKQSKQKFILTISDKSNFRFMSTNDSIVQTQLKSNQKLKLYREVQGKAILNSTLWYHTEKGYIHSSQAKIVEE